VPIDRTAFNALVDDDGSNTIGSVWNKTAIQNVLLDPIDAVINKLGAATELTLATDTVTVTAHHHRIDTEADAASDNLATLTAGSGVTDGFLLALKPENAARVVTVKDATGNILLKGGDLILNDAESRLLLIKDGANWYELARNTAGGGGTPGITTDGTHVQQIAFTATQAASADGNTFDDYEENIWTPTDQSGAALTFTSVNGTYVKLGQLVFARGELTFPSTANGLSVRIGGLPFTALSSGSSAGGVIVNYTDYGSAFNGYVIPNSTNIDLHAFSATRLTNANLSTKAVWFTAVYRASA
jgi:hypothetical protein